MFPGFGVAGVSENGESSLSLAGSNINNIENNQNKEETYFSVSIRDERKIFYKYFILSK